MSYTEYFDLYYITQKKECPFRAFTFDVINSRKQIQYIKEHTKHLECMLFVIHLLKQEELKTKQKILLNDNHNNLFDLKIPMPTNNNLNNPMILGDMVTYFVYNHSITTNRMLELFQYAIKKYNLEYSFHFATGVYETNSYADGNTKLYKGYMPQILESISKKNTFTINQKTILEELLNK